MVDTISSLGSIDFQTNARDVDVVVAVSQKGLMLPLGLSFNAISDEAWAASKTGDDRTSYRDWSKMAEEGPEVPAINENVRLNNLTAIFLPDDKGADCLRTKDPGSFYMSLGTGLYKAADRVFRIGHPGDCKDLMLVGTFCVVQMGLIGADIAHRKGGAQAAIEYLAERIS